MIVYVATRNDGFEDWEVVGVYSTLTDAQGAVETPSREESRPLLGEMLFTFEWENEEREDGRKAWYWSGPDLDLRVDECEVAGVRAGT